MSYTGKRIEVLNSNGGIEKTITVKSAKEVNNVLVVTDDEGNIYTEEQLNLSFVLTPEAIMFNALKAADVIDEDYDYFDNFPYSTMHKAVEEFMKGMVDGGYVARKEEDNEV